MTLSSIFSYPVIRAVSSDIVSGQIIASLIVLAFVAIFLLREWISQNARPGIFEEEEMPPVEQDQAPPEVPPPLVIAELPALHDRAEPRLPLPFDRENIRAQNVVPWHPREHVDNRIADQTIKESPNKRVRRTDDSKSSRERMRVRKDKGKRTTRLRRERSESDLPARQCHRRWTSPGVSMSSVHGSSDIGEDDISEAGDSRKQWVARTAEWAERQKAVNNAPLDLQPEQTQFTFRSATPQRVDVNATGVASSSVPPLNLDSEKNEFVFTAPKPQTAESTVPRGLPSSLGLESDRSRRSSSSPASDTTQVETLGEGGVLPVQSISPPITSPVDDTSSGSKGTRTPPHPSIPRNESVGSLRRPPLPSVTLPPSSGASPPNSVTRSSGHTPLTSPSLATYQAPEEFEAGPSNLADYFNEDNHSDGVRAETDPEFHKYFMDLDEGAEDEDAEPEMDEADHYHWSEEELRDDDDDDFDHVEAAGAIVQLEQPDGRPREDRLVAGEAVAQQVRAPANENRPPEQNDELDANIEDDMDGALEGNIYYMVSWTQLMEKHSYWVKRPTLRGLPKCTY